jgi:hypothetical protein
MKIVPDRDGRALLQVDSARAGDPLLVAIDTSRQISADGHMWTHDETDRDRRVFRLRVQLNEHHSRDLAALISTTAEQGRVIEMGELALQMGADSPEQREEVRRVLDVAAKRAGYTLA